jgi:hypothetical protein
MIYNRYNASVPRTLAAIAAAYMVFMCGAQVLFAWTAPTGLPGNNDTTPPINVGTGTQSKPGILGANILNIYGSNLYLNFGNPDGASGFGIRSNAGVLEGKDSGGVWRKLIDKPWFLASSTTAVWQSQGAGTWLYPTTLNDKKGNAAASFNSATGYFTAPEAGVYLCFFSGYKSYSAAGYHHTISTCSGGPSSVCNNFGNWDYTLASQGYSGYDQSTSQIIGLYNLIAGESITFRMYSDVGNSYAYYPPQSRMGCTRL